MRTTRLLSTIAATLLIGTCAAAAQGINGQVKPERAPAAQRNAPAEKIAPNMHAGERGSAETTGQGSTQTLKPGAGGNAGLNEHGTVGASPEKGESSGVKAGENGRTKVGDEVRDNSKTGNDHNAAKSERGSEHAQGSERSSKEAAREGSRSESKSGTTGQGAAAGASKLTTKQRTRIMTVIKRQKVESTHLNISVRVGVHIPTSVHYYPLPPEVVAIYPEWRGYDYILVGDQIVVIDPDGRAVVAIIET